MSDTAGPTARLSRPHPPKILSCPPHLARPGPPPRPQPAVTARRTRQLPRLQLRLDADQIRAYRHPRCTSQHRSPPGSRPRHWLGGLRSSRTRQPSPETSDRAAKRLPRQSQRQRRSAPSPVPSALSLYSQHPRCGLHRGRHRRRRPQRDVVGHPGVPGALRSGPPAHLIAPADCASSCPRSHPSRVRFSRPLRSSSTGANWPVTETRLLRSSASVTTSWPNTRAVPASGRSNVASTGSRWSCRQHWDPARRHHRVRSSVRRIRTDHPPDPHDVTGPAAAAAPHVVDPPFRLPILGRDASTTIDADTTIRAMTR